jgi:hypothetical protein
VYTEQADTNDPQTFVLKESFGWWKGEKKNGWEGNIIQRVSLNYKNQIWNFQNFYSLYHLCHKIIHTSNKNKKTQLNRSSPHSALMQWQRIILKFPHYGEAKNNRKSSTDYHVKLSNGIVECLHLTLNYLTFNFIVVSVALFLKLWLNHQITKAYSEESNIIPFKVSFKIPLNEKRTEKA